MSTINFILPDGTAKSVDVDQGTVMSAAVEHGVPGVLGECGGSLACATCHVYVEGGELAVLPEPSEFENEMLECTASERRVNSRLSCQIQICDVDGFTFRIPDSQI